jgi:serine/threonine-protein kinase
MTLATRSSREGDPMHAMADVLAPRAVFAGRFRIEALLGSGGMGTVYRAHDRRLEQVIALKLLHPVWLGEIEVLRRFEREARAAARIVHPAVTAVREAGYSDEGMPYLAMEYVPGPTLAALVATGPLAPGRALAILRQIAEGLAAAHAAGVIHRDLKPANVVVLQDDQVKILDFGQAKLIGPGESSLSTLGSTFGTPEYLSPEQIAGHPLGPATDLYSFGVLSFEVLTGRVPFRGALMEVIRGHVEEEPPRPSAIVAAEGIAPDLDRLVLGCLAKRPEDRPPSASALAALLAGG